MTTYYLAGYACCLDWEALRDDGGYDTIEDMAIPTGQLLLSRDEAHIAALLQEAWDNMDYSTEDRDEEGMDWRTDGWNDGVQKWYSEHLDAFVVLREVSPLIPMGGPE